MAKQSRALRLAKDALVAGMADDWPRATRVMQRLGDECGGDGVQDAVLAWIDTLIHRMGHTPGKPVRIEFMNVDNGAITDADGVVRPEVVWAGRMIAARAADDRDTWQALGNALPEDPIEVGAHISAVLETCVLMLGRMGGGRG